MCSVSLRSPRGGPRPSTAGPCRASAGTAASVAAGRRCRSPSTCARRPRGPGSPRRRCRASGRGRCLALRVDGFRVLTRAFGLALRGRTRPPRCGSAGSGGLGPAPRPGGCASVLPVPRPAPSGRPDDHSSELMPTRRPVAASPPAAGRTAVAGAEGRQFTHARNDSSSRQRVTTSQVRRSSVGAAARNPRSPPGRRQPRPGRRSAGELVAPVLGHGDGVDLDHSHGAGSCGHVCRRAGWSASHDSSPAGRQLAPRQAQGRRRRTSGALVVGRAPVGSTPTTTLRGRCRWCRVKYTDRTMP